MAFLDTRIAPRSQRRFQGYRSAAVTAGVFSENRALTIMDLSNLTLGARLCTEVMARAPETDAILCNNDSLWSSDETRRLGLSIPDRLRHGGFNDLEMMTCAEPWTTSMRTYRYRMGHQGCRNAAGPVEQQGACRVDGATQHQSANLALR
ncbi:substrate-binding domain-containing protein [Puniceibacterium sediminis]|uniref:substrate-binding domain-containing protein n=1 Tax=Puniceibacterium sediminis TaxID=1608407 RepID=UPI000B782E09|nr:substrate-binding domain-containing protein [Puniceibacterium sediminis]